MLYRGYQSATGGTTEVKGKARKTAENRRQVCSSKTAGRWIRNIAGSGDKIVSFQEKREQYRQEEKRKEEEKYQQRKQEQREKVCILIVVLWYHMSCDFSCDHCFIYY